jgi:seryl-tRNA synthetase
MNFKLIGRMILNREISDDQFEKDLKGFIKEANDSILIKGAPSGKGAVVTDWKLKDNSIHLTITSGQYVRPHEAILRLKKNFGDKFGKKYKLGVRTVSADNYLIDFPI